MKLKKVTPKPNKLLQIVFTDDSKGWFDVKPYLDFEAFSPLKNNAEFNKVINGKYFIEWASGADLSADTIKAHLSKKSPVDF